MPDRVPERLVGSASVGQGAINAIGSIGGSFNQTIICQAPPPGQPSPVHAMDSNFGVLGIAPNPMFTGRDRELDALRSAMFPRNGPASGRHGRASAITQGFTGEGGIGKSQLAQRFAEVSCVALRPAGGDDPYEGQFPRAEWVKFDCVWWLDCAAATHAQAVRDLAIHLGHHPTPQDTPATLRAVVRDRLDPSKHHLLILDNLEELTEEQVRADGGTGRWAMAGGWALRTGSRVLITTRAHNLPRTIACRVELGVLSPEDARELLRGNRGDLHDGSEETANSALHAGLDAVTEHLGRLALAVDLARAWLELHPGETPGTLLAELKKSDAAALALFEGDELKGQAHNYRLSVATALALHMDSLAGTAAERLLFAAAFAAPDRIPAGFLWAIASVEKTAAREGLAALASKSIIHHAPGEFGGAVSIHRLTQAVVRTRLERKGADAMSAVLGPWFRAAWSLYQGPDHDEVRPSRVAAAPHVVAAARWALSSPFGEPLRLAAAVCLQWSGVTLSLIGDLASAEAAVADAVAWAEVQGPSVARKLANFRAARADIRRVRGNLAGAEEDVRQSLAFYESQVPGDRQIWIDLYGVLAEVLRCRGDFAGAESEISKCIAWRESQANPNERGMVLDYATRADIRRRRGNFAGAEMDVEKSFALAERQTRRDERMLASLRATRAQIRRDQAAVAHGFGLVGEAARLAALAKADIDIALAWYQRELPGDQRSIALLVDLRELTQRADAGA